MTILFKVEDFTRKIYKVTGSERSRGTCSAPFLTQLLIGLTPLPFIIPTLCIRSS
jgi:hypothetical protein